MDPAQRLEGRTIGEGCQIDFDVRCQRATDDTRPIRSQLLGGQLPPSLYDLQRCSCRKPFFELDGADVHGSGDAAAFLVHAFCNPAPVTFPHG